jgi:hypothetical protein
MGGLAPSAGILRLIEDIHGEDDVGMQNSFQAYDGCSGKSNLLDNALCFYADYFKTRWPR